jgi:DNA-binding CsgD family transcriptional regulator/PAS domain-containing protein
MAADDRLTRTVEAIYAAGAEGGRWTDALAMVADYFGAAGATLEIFDRTTWGVVEFHQARLPEGSEVAYLEHYAADNPRIAYAVRHMSEATLCDYKLIDEQAMDRDGYYMKYLKPSGLRYFLSTQILDGAGGIVTIQRTRRQGHVDGKQVAMMERLAPHLRRSYEMATRLKAARATAGELEQTIDLLADGVVLLDRSGRIIRANAAFDTIAARNDGIRVAEGEVALTDRTARDRLGSALSDALSGDIARSGAAADFSTPRPGGLPDYLVSVRPLASREKDGKAAAIIFIRDPLAEGDRHLRQLREIFELTDAEAHLALALTEGLSPGSYARARGVSPHTVYSHLRRIKDKTGATHMPGLIHRLSSAGAPSPAASRPAEKLT